MRVGTIAAGEKNTAEAAAALLEAGGNAFDASVGAVFTSMTSEFTLTGPCGGGALLAYPIDSDPLVYDFFVNTPSSLPSQNTDFFKITVDFGPSSQDFHIGLGSVAVPGTLAGLLYVHKKHGCLPLKTVLEPAIFAAKHGIRINDAHAYLYKILDPILSLQPQGKKLFHPNNRVLHAGDKFKNIDFADFLDTVQTEGSDYFYRGAGAKDFLSLMNDGGLVTPKDLINYRVIERKPLMSAFANKQLLSNPAPSTGGTLISFILQLLDRAKIKSSSSMAMAFHAANLTRAEICLDPTDEYQISRILNTSIINPWINFMDTFDNDPPSRGATTHVSIMDKDGNAASVTTTNGEGCGYVLPGMGIMPNNMLGEEDLNPLGFHRWTGGRRLPTMMSPSMVVGKNGPELVLGSGGSNRIRSAISQVIFHVLTNKLDLQSAIKAPRMHLDGNTLHCEPEISFSKGLPKWIHLHRWKSPNLYFGGVHAVTKTDAVGDPRRDGYGIVL